MKKIVFVDYGSGGNAGLYINSFIELLNNKRYKFYVSKSFPFKKTKNTYQIFHLITSGINENYVNNKIINLLKFFELVIALIVIAISNYRNTVIISLYQPFKTYYLLIRFLKIFKCKVGIIIHDVKPLYSKLPEVLFIDQEKFYSISDFLVSHNNFSTNILKVYNKNIYQISFPLFNVNNKNNKLESNDLNILFIGNFRKGKGIEFLIKFIYNFKIDDKIKFTIAGYNDYEYEFSTIENKATIIDKYLSDEEFETLISNCDYGILPYEEGTNSGILSNFIGLEKPVIVSNLKMFNENQYVNKELMFSINEQDELFDILTKIKNPNNRHKHINFIKKCKKNMKKDFKNSLLNLTQSFFEN